MRYFTSAVLLAIALPAVGMAQNNGPMTTTVEGEVTAIDDSGRTTVITVTDTEGKEHELRVTPKLSLEIKAAGDEGFIRKGAFVGGQGTMTNDMLFVKDISVLLPAKGQKLPRGRIAKSARKVGASQNTYDIMGTIEAAQPNPDYPDYQMIALDVRGNYPTINLEKNVKINVVSMNSEMVEVGMPVELQGIMSRGRFNLNKVVINRSEPFKSEDVFSAEEEE